MLLCYSLPKLSLEHKHVVTCRPHRLALNCDSTYVRMYVCPFVCLFDHLLACTHAMQETLKKYKFPTELCSLLLMSHFLCVCLCCIWHNATESSLKLILSLQHAGNCLSLTSMEYYLSLTWYTPACPYVIAFDQLSLFLSLSLPLSLSFSLSLSLSLSLHIHTHTLNTLTHAPPYTCTYLSGGKEPRQWWCGGPSPPGEEGGVGPQVGRGELASLA